MVPNKPPRLSPRNNYSPERGFAITTLVALVVFGVWQLASHSTSLSNAKFFAFVAVMAAYWIVTVICTAIRQ